MRGLSIPVMSVLLIVVVVASASLLYVQMKGVSNTATSKADELVDVRISPKLLGLACLDSYGYLIVSSDSPLKGKVYYTVKYGLDEVASGFSDVNITDVGRIYFNASMTEGKEYTVEVTARYWSLRENCKSYLPN